uniref:Odorant receptor n=1 Tax=Anopheles funestus TaxID=62324 RepID=A0A4Y0BE29_ANOFN
MVTKVIPFSNSDQDDVTVPSKWKIFKLQRMILLIFGCWPSDGLRRPWHMKALAAINLLTLAVCILGESLYGVYSYRNGRLNEAIESICPTAARLSGFLRMCFILNNMQKIVNVLNRISNIIQTDQHPRENSDTTRLMLLGQQFTKYMLYASVGTAVSYVLYRTSSWPTVGFKANILSQSFYAFKLLLPFDSQDPVLFTLSTIFLNYASIPTVTSMLGDVTLFTGICIYIPGQFQAIKLELEAISATLDNNSVKSSAPETRRVNLELRRICKRHEDIIDLVADTRSAFTPNILIVYIFASIMLCVVCVAVFAVEGIYKLIYIPYTMSVLTVLYFYSYSGTVISYSGDSVQTMAYDFPWYRFDRNTRHLIQMMMIRAQYGSNVDVPFFETSLASFSTIVRTASSYITLMKSFL